MTQLTDQDIREIKGAIADLNTSVTALRGEMRGELSSIRADLNTSVTALRDEMRGELSSIRTDIKVMDTRLIEVEKKIDKVDSKIDKQDNRLWGLGFLVLAPVMTGFVAVVVRLFFMSPNP